MPPSPLRHITMLHCVLTFFYDNSRIRNTSCDAGDFSHIHETDTKKHSLLNTICASQRPKNSNNISGTKITNKCKVVHGWMSWHDGVGSGKLNLCAELPLHSGSSQPLQKLKVATWVSELNRLQTRLIAKCRKQVLMEEPMLQHIPHVAE